MKNGKVADNFRLKRALPTINYLRENKAKIVLCGHLDRPDGKVVEELSLKPVAKHLDKLLTNTHLQSPLSPISAQTPGSIKKLKPGQVLILENLRFHPEEKKNSKQFAKQLASLADLYINDCFSSCHRNHASITGVPQHLPSYAGIHLAKEIEMLDKARKKPKKPVIAIIGGAKVESKSKAIERLTPLVDHILLGGKLMFKKSLEKNPKVIFPTDSVGAYDIGPKTVQGYLGGLQYAGTIIWAGPLGKFEDPTYAEGTKQIAKTVAKSKAYTIIGGGDTVAAFNKFGLTDGVDWVCSGGGAMLKYIGEGTLVGIEAVQADLPTN